MSKLKQEFIYYLLLIIISILLVLDLFINPGLPASFDSPFHITNIAQFTVALKSGDIPVIWQNGFANYGLPIGLISHQLPSYLGSLINLIVDNPTTSYFIVIFIGVVLSNILYFRFLRIYFSPLLALIGAFIFNFAPYRIINVYVRGAEPELFSNLFVPLILISLYYFIEKRKIWSLFLFTFSIFLLALTHPMNFLIYFFVIGPYFLFLVWQRTKRLSPKLIFSKFNLITTLILGAFTVIGVGMASYYLIPLNLEIKYFYYGSSTGQLTPNQFLGIVNYLNPNWYYFTENDIFTRGHFIKSGLLETASVLIGVVTLTYLILKKRYSLSPLLFFAVPTSIILIFFTTPLSSFVYETISVLGSIQFPWRMMNGFIFLPPIIILCLLTLIKKRMLVIFLIVILVSLIRFPELYGKNYTVYDQSSYYSTVNNAHSVLMNTVWMGKPQDYPVKKQQSEIIEGEGKIESSEISNSWRKYTVNAQTPIRLVDYTFYFPGWTVYVNGEETDIQFQDPDYRGVVTYSLDKGSHDVLLKFEDTKIRLLGKVLSVIFVFVFIFLVILRNRLRKLIFN